MVAGPSQIELEVPTADCGICRAAIESAVRALKGVLAADVDLGTRRVRVRFDPAALDVAAIVDALTVAGYPPEPWQTQKEDEIWPL